MDEPASSYASQSRTWLCPNRQLTNILCQFGQDHGQRRWPMQFQNFARVTWPKPDTQPQQGESAEVTKAHGSLVADSLFFVRLLVIITSQEEWC